jgi:hypothetical protein
VADRWRDRGHGVQETIGFVSELQDIADAPVDPAEPREAS